MGLFLLRNDNRKPRIPTAQHSCRVALTRQFRFNWFRSASSRDVVLPSLPILCWGRAIDIQNASNSLAALTDWDLIFSHWSYSTLSKKQWRPRFTVELWNFFGVQILGIPGFVYKYPRINRALTVRLRLPPHVDLPRNFNEPPRVYTVEPKHLNSAWDWRRKLTKSPDIERNSWKCKMQRQIINVQVVTLQWSFWMVEPNLCEGHRAT